MDRRNFLKIGAAGTAAASLGLATGFSPEPRKKEIEAKTRLDVKGYVSEPAKKIPVVDAADIVVLGGGPAGVAAAVSAARQGLDVILLEREYYLGGLWTGCCVLPVNNTSGLLKNGKWGQVIYGFSDEICSRLASMGLSVTIKGDTPVPDPEAAKYVMELMLGEAGVRLLYNCQGAGVILSGDRIDAVLVESKSGRVAIKAKAVVDCSGDGDILEWAGEDFELRKAHIGAMWRCGNAADFKRRGVHKTPIDSVKLFHTNGEYDQDGLDIYNLTRLQLKMRKHMWDTLEKDRQLPGGENLFLLDSTTLLGVRVTRVLNSVRNVTYADSVRYASYADCVGVAGADNSLKYSGGTLPGKKRPVWQLPYSAITPKRIPNLLVAGRCFGFDKDLTYDAREVGTCFLTGQAAGTAAALSLLDRCSVQEVNIVRLQARLAEGGVRFDM